VRVVAQGSRAAGEKLLQLLEGGGTPGRVDKIVADWSQPGEQFDGFFER
jgi:acylphosphatase